MNLKTIFILEIFLIIHQISLLQTWMAPLKQWFNFNLLLKYNADTRRKIYQFFKCKKSKGVAYDCRTPQSWHISIASRYSTKRSAIPPPINYGTIPGIQLQYLLIFKKQDLGFNQNIRGWIHFRMAEDEMWGYCNRLRLRHTVNSGKLICSSIIVVFFAIILHQRCPTCTSCLISQIGHCRTRPSKSTQRR